MMLTSDAPADSVIQLSKMSWLPDILVYRSSIIPTILGSVSVVTLFSGAVAAVSGWWGTEVGLPNNVGESPSFPVGRGVLTNSPLALCCRWITLG